MASNTSEKSSPNAFDEVTEPIFGNHRFDMESGGIGMRQRVRLGRPSSVKSLRVQTNKFSRECFYTQAVLIYIIAIACILNLSIGTEPSNVWVALLSASVGYLLPSPKISKGKNKVVDFPVDQQHD